MVVLAGLLFIPISFDLYTFLSENLTGIMLDGAPTMIIIAMSLGLLLNEVVVVGYGRIKRTIDQLIQGKVLEVRIYKHKGRAYQGQHLYKLCIEGCFCHCYLWIQSGQWCNTQDY